ncbi:diaminobutyrate--2-oxoglutarate transaminase [Paenibacillus selenitireducens]|uniref:Diaminobutyrate--2-oxoglutarate transaminase n=1 Tax=Paenibacillus selenitireducens TaxID=1324314 RepID=A0A1T2XL52_9BACL|nr:diaminobutyrate--2-oxoglutarate transaminase [Paenibacillus selenitireducens]OPA80594.1 diaminobutyrate--2-oxoglutarate transaminase [Paenibacillus selenitireducens]
METIFTELESNVRSYCRSFPKVFGKAKMCEMYDEDGQRYLDFFSGAGALNYGHNNPYIKDSLMNYLETDGILHALDMFTEAKRTFLDIFKEYVLNPKGYDYKVMFCGPTGTNSVEAAVKLARKVKGRETIFAFSGAFHGMTLGSLSLTSNIELRKGAGIPLNNVVFMPFPYGFNASFDTIGYIENILNDDHSGIEKPAAIIVETIQAEGGVVVASSDWLKRLRDMCDQHDILLICDEIQVGCGRTGTFFSFERAGIVPDLVTLSKSISGLGLPMSLLLFKSEYDIWNPGEHNGTFRGNQLAFVCGSAALEYMYKEDLLNAVKIKEEFLVNFIEHEILSSYPLLKYRGKGLIYGIDFSRVPEKDVCFKVARKCFERGLIIERAGRNDSVLKILPPLVITLAELKEGLSKVKESIDEVFCDNF